MYWGWGGGQGELRTGTVREEGQDTLAGWAWNASGWGYLGWGQCVGGSEETGSKEVPVWSGARLASPRAGGRASSEGGGKGPPDVQRTSLDEGFGLQPLRPDQGGLSGDPSPSAEGGPGWGYGPGAFLATPRAAPRGTHLRCADAGRRPGAWTARPPWRKRAAGRHGRRPPLPALLKRTPLAPWTRPALPRPPLRSRYGSGRVRPAGRLLRSPSPPPRRPARPRPRRRAPPLPGAGGLGAGDAGTARETETKKRSEKGRPGRNGKVHGTETQKGMGLVGKSEGMGVP